ncbi:hypothetical protein FS827_13290 [Agrobacterium vitis]|uniref:hypothetical protein n=1 Tax=Allorhizobium ampelinum TaxID=3025782 RepID=UPI001F307DCC|nr:hypothetical protein [Allorhizobium ampelinum]MCF1462285.1 hypothetical protein [Allorhizobium ampelinum]
MTVEQEIVSPTEPKYEGVATISGTFDGKTMTDFTRIEMMGTGAADPVAEYRSPRTPLGGISSQAQLLPSL